MNWSLIFQKEKEKARLIKFISREYLNKKAQLKVVGGIKKKKKKITL